MKTTEFKIGEQVWYVPCHAKDSLAHPDVQRGIVTSINEQSVFVDYSQSGRGIATPPKLLRK